MVAPAFPLDALTFEQVFAELTASFVAMPVDAIDAHIDATIGRVAEFLGLDRAHVAQRLPATGLLTVTQQWNRPGHPTVFYTSEDRLPWLAERLARAELVAIRRLEDFPPEAVSEREHMIRYGERSLLLVPLAVGGAVVGALGFATLRSECDWAPELVERLRLVGQIVASALARKQSDSELRRALAENMRLRRRLEAENLYLRSEVEEAHDLGAIVGQSALIRAVLKKAEQVADIDTAVLLVGETGTGKELVARAIHARSPRKERALIAVNCAALPATLVESELFGHEKGAFTGATSAKPGRFELADGGTLFLDEIGELDTAIQAKLLRVLQDGEVQRLGGTRGRKVDVRLIAATNRDLEGAMESGRFRADLFYRLNVFPIELPPLRARREDVPLLAWYFIQARQRVLGRSIDQVPQAAMEVLCAYSWPGNVRELQNVIERALILSTGPVLRIEEALGVSAGAAKAGSAGHETLRDADRVHVLEILERCDWVIEGPGQAAERLGLKPSTLRNKMKRLGIQRPSARAKRRTG